METIQNIVSWYTSNAFLLTPLFLAIFVMGISLAIFQFIGDRYLRLPLLLLISVGLLIASFFPGVYTTELYLNLSMQVFMVLLAIFITAFAAQQESWFLPALLTVVLAISLQFFTPSANIGSNIPTTLGATLIGALMAAYMLRQEWAWSPVMQKRRLSASMRKARQEQAAEDARFGDYFMLIRGHDEATIDERIAFLQQHDMSIIYQDATEYDDETENYYRLINVQIETVVKDPDSVLLSNAEARIQILAFPDALKRVYKQLSEVLITRDRKRIEADDPQMAHVELRVDIPQKYYSQMIEERFYDLVRQWQYSEHPALQEATDHLITWAKDEGFVQN